MRNWSCCICGGDPKLGLKLKPMPLTDDYNNGLNSELFPTEFYFCPSCGHKQLGFVVSSKKIFNSKYAYKSGFSPGLKLHFEDLAFELIDSANLNSHSLVVDVGCNDGTFLIALKNKIGCRVSGIDPALGGGISGIKDNLSDAAVEMVNSSYGKADLVVANNVLAHVENPIEFLTLIRKMVKITGFFCCEVGDFNAIMNENVWENIYHEHLSYFDTDTLFTLLLRTGFDPIRIEKINTHGGSIRMICKAIEPKPWKFINEEKFELDLSAVGDNVIYRRNKILEFCGVENIVAFGASAKASVILHQTGLRPLAVVDDNPMKQGKEMPGTNIPIVSRKILEGLSGKILILAWNETEAIKNSLPQNFSGRMVVASPEPYVI